MENKTKGILALGAAGLGASMYSNAVKGVMGNMGNTVGAILEHTPEAIFTLGAAWIGKKIGGKGVGGAVGAIGAGSLALGSMGGILGAAGATAAAPALVTGGAIALGGAAVQRMVGTYGTLAYAAIIAGQVTSAPITMPLLLGITALYGLDKIGVIGGVKTGLKNTVNYTTGKIQNIKNGSKKMIGALNPMNLFKKS